MTRVYLTPGRNGRGCLLRDDNGLDLAGMSWMDAAELLFHLKDEMRKTAIRRDCVDAVAHKRRKAA